MQLPDARSPGRTKVARDDALHACSLGRAERVLLVLDHERRHCADEDIDASKDARQLLHAVEQIALADLHSRCAEGLSGGLGQRRGADEGCNSLSTNEYDVSGKRP